MLSCAGGTKMRLARLDADVTSHTHNNIIKEGFLVFFLSFLFVLITFFVNTIR